MLGRKILEGLLGWNEYNHNKYLYRKQIESFRKIEDKSLTQWFTSGELERIHKNLRVFLNDV